MISLTDHDRAIDWMAEYFFGLVKDGVAPLFQVRRSRQLAYPKLALQLEERICVDQFGNLCVGFAGNLMDSELWVWGARVGAEKWTDRGKETVLVREWKKFKTFDDDLLACLQDRAFVAMGKANLAILKARHAAKLPAVGSGVGKPVITL